MFTKTVAEHLVRQKEGKMPIVMLRPGIGEFYIIVIKRKLLKFIRLNVSVYLMVHFIITVINAYREPSPGWVDKSAIFGACGVSFHITFSNVLLNKQMS